MQIYDWLDGLATFYPELVDLYTIGETAEGNPLKLVKISYGKRKAVKPGVYIDARKLLYLNLPTQKNFILHI